MAAVHGPVDDYPEFMEKTVDGILSRLGSDPVWRRIYFIHSDNTLHQPNRPAKGDPVITSSAVGEKLFVRSERQKSSCT